MEEERLRRLITAPSVSPWLQGRFFCYNPEDVRDDGYVEGNVIFWTKRVPLVIYRANCDHPASEVAAAVRYALATGVNTDALKRQGLEFLDTKKSFEKALGRLKLYGKELFQCRSVEDVFLQAATPPTGEKETELRRRFKEVARLAKQLTDAENLLFDIPL